MSDDELGRRRGGRGAHSEHLSSHDSDALALDDLDHDSETFRIGRDIMKSIFSKRRGETAKNDTATDTHQHVSNGGKESRQADSMEEAKGIGRGSVEARQEGLRGLLRKMPELPATMPPPANSVSTMSQQQHRVSRRPFAKARAYDGHHQLRTRRPQSRHSTRDTASTFSLTPNPSSWSTAQDHRASVAQHEKARRAISQIAEILAKTKQKNHHRKASTSACEAQPAIEPHTGERTSNPSSCAEAPIYLFNDLSPLDEKASTNAGKLASPQTSHSHSALPSDGTNGGEKSRDHMSKLPRRVNVPPAASRFAQHLSFETMLEQERSATTPAALGNLPKRHHSLQHSLISLHGPLRSPATKRKKKPPTHSMTELSALCHEQQHPTVQLPQQQQQQLDGGRQPQPQLQQRQERSSSARSAQGAPKNTLNPLEDMRRRTQSSLSGDATSNMGRSSSRRSTTMSHKTAPVACGDGQREQQTRRALRRSLSRPNTASSSGRSEPAALVGDVAKAGSNAQGSLSGRPQRKRLPSRPDMAEGHIKSVRQTSQQYCDAQRIRSAPTSGSLEAPLSRGGNGMTRARPKVAAAHERASFSVGMEFVDTLKTFCPGFRKSNGSPPLGNLIFDSDFESGNLQCAEKTGQAEYALTIRPDMHSESHRLWFNFKVWNAQANQHAVFHILNFSKTKSLFSRGSSPVVRSRKRPHWTRVGGNNVFFYRRVPAKKSTTQLTFSYVFDDPNDEYEFAYCYPYTYSHLQARIVAWKDAHRSLMCHSILSTTLLGLNCDLLTISSPANLRRLSASDLGKGRGRIPTIFISARVHPGETPASFVCDGFVSHLLSEDSSMVAFRDAYIIKVVPMLNPDGVYHGTYRCNTVGLDLNRCWDKPSFTKCPTISSLKSLLIQEKKERPLPCFLDLHGHTTALNSFIYGNKFYDSTRMEEEWQLPFRLSETTDMFSLSQTKFNCDKAKSGTGRRTIGAILGASGHSYTLETSFYGYESSSTADAHELPTQIRGGFQANSGEESSLVEEFDPDGYRALGAHVADALAERYLSTRYGQEEEAPENQQKSNAARSKQHHFKFTSH